MAKRDRRDFPHAGGTDQYQEGVCQAMNSTLDSRTSNLGPASSSLDPRSSILKFLTCGSVDDGKSTLIGHLLYQTGNIPVDQLQLLVSESARIGTAGSGLDYSLLLDGLLAEREQGITIDVAYRYFTAAGRKFIVADTPGHEQYTRNMATGASQCTAALILVDARQGILPQTPATP